MSYRSNCCVFSPEPRVGRVRLSLNLISAALRPRDALMLWHALRRTWCESLGFHADAAFHQRRFNELLNRGDSRRAGEDR